MPARSDRWKAAVAAGCDDREVHVHLWSFIGVAVLVILLPGPDMALVTKNAVLHGRRAALATAFGVNVGLVVWTVAAALGVAAAIRSSEIAFTVLKVIGSAYLVWLGARALLAAHNRSRLSLEDDQARGTRELGGLCGFRQGVLSNLANPKIAAVFTSLLPQFVAPGGSALAAFLLLGAIFVVITLIWLSTYAAVAARAAATLRRPALAKALDRLTGVVLIGLGLRLATESR